MAASKVARETPRDCAAGQVDCRNWSKAASAKAGVANTSAAKNVSANRIYVMPGFIPGIHAFESFAA